MRWFILIYSSCTVEFTGCLDAIFVLRRQKGMLFGLRYPALLCTMYVCVRSYDINIQAESSREYEGSRFGDLSPRSRTSSEMKSSKLVLLGPLDLWIRQIKDIDPPMHCSQEGNWYRGHSDFFVSAVVTVSFRPKAQRVWRIRFEDPSPCSRHLSSSSIWVIIAATTSSSTNRLKDTSHCQG